MFFEAQLITQELKKGNDNIDKQGHVYLYPESTLGKKELTAYETLNYIKYDSQDPNDNNTFKKKLAANATDIQNYFSVNDEGKLVLASLETTNIKKVTKTEGKLFDKTENSTSYVITEIVIDYKNLISQYSTPMTFFLELGMVTRNPNFLEAVVNMVKENTNIQLTVLNTTTEEITTQIDKYTEHTISREAYWGPDNSFVEPEITEEEEEVSVTETTTTTVTTIIPTVKVTNVNTWICEQNINYSKLPDEKTSVDSTIDQQSEPEKTLSDDTSDLEDKALEEGVPVKESVSWITREPTTVNITTTIQKYDSGIPSDYKYKAGEKPDEDPNYASFVDLLDVLYKIPNSKEKRTAGAYLKTDTDMFFNLLQQHPETQGMEQIMRYIMYKYTGKNYGVTELDFSIFDVNYFSSIASGGTLSNYIKAWENLGLWKYESGNTNVKPTQYLTSKDGKDYYIVYEDGSNGHNNIAYGIATFITNSSNVKAHHSLYGDGYYNWQTQFDSYGVDVTTLKTGDLVEKDVALAVFSTILKENFEDPVDNYLREHGITLEKCQRDALVAVKYQYGNIGNFAEAYNRCGNTDALKTSFQTANGAQPFNGSTDRKVANWNLFHTGVYMAKDGTEIKSGILEIADTIHKYMEENRYQYCVNNAPNNSYEEHKNNPSACGLSTTFEGSKINKNTCCATYVSWVLQEAGYLTDAEHTDGANNLRNKLMQKGWQMINNVNDLEPGDVICYSGHIEIYAGDGKVYNAGSGNAIRKASPASKDVSSMMYGLRAPN